MGFLFSKSKPPETPITNVFVRVKNIAMNNACGILGSIPIFMLPFVLRPYDDLRDKPERTVLVLWIAFFFCHLLHPVRPPVMAFVPIFIFPVLHVIDSDKLSKSYMTQNSTLYAVGGYLRDLLHTSGFTQRIIMLITGPDESQQPINTLGMLIKASVAAYVMSIFSSRTLLLGFMISKIVAPLKRHGSGNADFRKFRCILSHAIVSSSVIGSIAIVNGSDSVMFMRTVWEVSKKPDVFNFLDYSCFALPLSICLFIINLAIQIVTLKIFVGVPSADTMKLYKKDLLDEKRKNAGKAITLHEIQTIIATLLVLIGYMTRWSSVLKKLAGTEGWAGTLPHKTEKGGTRVPDATIATLVLLITSVLPMSFRFTQIFTARKQGDLPEKKPDTAILFWKAIDKNYSYGHLFLMGSFGALAQIVKETGVGRDYLWNFFEFVTTKPLPVAILIWTIMSTILGNFMEPTLAAGNMSVMMINCVDVANTELINKQYLLLLATGLGTSFSLAADFRLSPGSYNRLAHINLFQQIPFALLSCVACVIFTWVVVTFFGPVIFELGDTS